MGKRPHVEVFGTDYPTPDGTCVRDYIHVDDLAAAHVLRAGEARAGTELAYNVGIGRGYSVREVIETVEEVTGVKVPVKEGAAPRRRPAGAGRERRQDPPRTRLGAEVHRPPGDRRDRVELAQGAPQRLTRDDGSDVRQLQPLQLWDADVREKV